MKKILVVGLYVILFTFLFSFKITNAGYKVGSNKEMDDHSHVGVIENQKALMNRDLSYQGEVIALYYKETNNQSDLLPEQRADSFGTYDVYLDNQHTEYLFVYNTDLFCGMKEKYMSISLNAEIGIDEKTAILNADEYLSGLFPKDVIDFYIYDSCTFDAPGGLYNVCFFNPLGEYKTDDKINIWVRQDGSIAAFSAFNFLRYNEFDGDSEKIDKQKNLNMLAKNTTKRKIFNYTLQDMYISLNDQGELIFVNDIVYNVNAGSVVLQERDKIEQVLSMK